MSDAEISNIVVSNKVNFRKRGFKYFIGYKDGKNVRPLCLMLPNMSAFSRDICLF